MRTVTLMKEARFAKHGEILTTVTLPHTWNTQRWFLNISF